MITETEREVRERRLTALLEEAAGGGAPQDLAERVLSRVRSPRPARPRRGATLLAAVLMLGGIAVVVATARSRSAASEVPAQDPTPPPRAEVRKVDVTTEMVRAACKAIDASPPPGDGVTRLLALAKDGPIGVVVAPGVQGDSKADLAGLTLHESIGRIAVELGAGVADFGTMVVVGIGPVVPAERLRCTISAKDLDVRDLGKVLHAKTGTNFVAAGDLAGRVSIDVEAVPVRALLDVIAQKLSLDVVGCGSVLALRRAGERSDRDRVYIDLRQRAVGDVFGTWAKLSGANLVLDRAVVTGIVSVRAMKPVPQDLVDAAGAAVGAEVQLLERGITRVLPRLTKAEVTLVAESLSDWPTFIELVDVKVTIEAPPSAVRIWTDNAQTLDVLRAAAIATGRTFVRTDQGYTLR